MKLSFVLLLLWFCCFVGLVVSFCYKWVRNAGVTHSQIVQMHCRRCNLLPVYHFVTTDGSCVIVSYRNKMKRNV